MKSFVQAAVLLAIFQTVLAVPIESPESKVATQETDLYHTARNPPWRNPRARDIGPITDTDTGAIGGNGGTIDIDITGIQGGETVNAKGAINGENGYGDVAPGAGIINGRTEQTEQNSNFRFPPIGSRLCHPYNPQESGYDPEFIAICFPTTPVMINAQGEPIIHSRDNDLAHLRTPSLTNTLKSGVKARLAHCQRSRSPLESGAVTLEIDQEEGDQIAEKL